MFFNKKLIIAFLFALCIISCRDEEVNSPLIGTKWIESKLVSENCTDSDWNDIDNSGCSDGDCQNLTFSETNIIVESIEGGQVFAEDEIIPYESDGLYIYVEDERYKYSISGNKLTVYFGSRSKGDLCDDYAEYIAE
ncbi:hypothetical protein [Marinigracilibium pacificum]|uniref:Lipocalin-like protein n=1 Tax=Marinigracilibium pacificum TaxID=2729599 RepID=A0A848J7U4_9BACT|nr:hypothetical protein [Marinigracilibium pacificum]NMM50494.1 hypothetical protein [Marinigracilibium pacificum]